MKSETYKFVTHFILKIVLLTGCSGDLPNQKAGDPFADNLREKLNEISVEWNTHPGSSEAFEPLYLLPTGNCDRIIVIDRSTLEILFMNNSGEVLSRKGGKGNGPGEFQSLLSPFIDYDNRLYTIDGISKRITIYKIDDKELSYLSSVSYKEPPQYFLNSLYVTQHGNFGVYQVSSEGFFSPENKFLLYRLDDKFTPIHQLVEMPGNERFKSVRNDFTFYTPHRYLGRSIWGLDDAWFYYTTTMYSTINLFHLETEEQQKINPLQMEERPNSDNFTRLVKENYDPDNREEQYWEILNNIETLPLLSQMIFANGKIILQIMTPPGMEGLAIYFNKESEQIKRLRTPNEFNPTSVCGDTIYGVDLQLEGEHKIMSIELVSD